MILNKSINIGRIDLIVTQEVIGRVRRLAIEKLAEIDDSEEKFC